MPDLLINLRFLSESVGLEELRGKIEKVAHQVTDYSTKVNTLIEAQSGLTASNIALRMSLLRQGLEMAKQSAAFGDIGGRYLQLANVLNILRNAYVELIFRTKDSSLVENYRQQAAILAFLEPLARKVTYSLDQLQQGYVLNDKQVSNLIAELKFLVEQLGYVKIATAGMTEESDLSAQAQKRFAEELNSMLMEVKDVLGDAGEQVGEMIKRLEDLGVHTDRVIDRLTLISGRQAAVKAGMSHLRLVTQLYNVALSNLSDTMHGYMMALAAARGNVMQLGFSLLFLKFASNLWAVAIGAITTAVGFLVSRLISRWIERNKQLKAKTDEFNKALRGLGRTIRLSKKDVEELTKPLSELQKQLGLPEITVKDWEEMFKKLESIGVSIPQEQMARFQKVIMLTAASLRISPTELIDTLSELAGVTIANLPSLEDFRGMLERLGISTHRLGKTFVEQTNNLVLLYNAFIQLAASGASVQDRLSFLFGMLLQLTQPIREVVNGIMDFFLAKKVFTGGAREISASVEDMRNRLIQMAEGVIKAEQASEVFEEISKRLDKLQKTGTRSKELIDTINSFNKAIEEGGKRGLQTTEVAFLLAEAILQGKMSLVALAQAFGVSNNVIADFLNGIRSFSEEMRAIFIIDFIKRMGIASKVVESLTGDITRLQEIATKRGITITLIPPEPIDLDKAVFEGKKTLDVDTSPVIYALERAREAVVGVSRDVDTLKVSLSALSLDPNPVLSGLVLIKSAALETAVSFQGLRREIDEVLNAFARLPSRSVSLPPVSAFESPYEAGGGPITYEEAATVLTRPISRSETTININVEANVTSAASIGDEIARRIRRVIEP